MVPGNRTGSIVQWKRQAKAALPEVFIEQLWRSLKYGMRVSAGTRDRLNCPKNWVHICYRVDDLHALVSALKAKGCNVLDKIDESDYGTFAWVMDPEGNKVKLWQPPTGRSPSPTPPPSKERSRP